MKIIWNIISIVSFALLVYQFFFQKNGIAVIGMERIESFETSPVCYITEEMPRFSGCEIPGFSKAERQTCSNNKLLEFVYSNLKYPSIYSHITAEGTAVVQFTVEKDGSLTDIKILKDLSPGLGNELVKVIKMMPKWIPGKQFGKAVRVRFNLPIKIRLD